MKCVVVWNVTSYLLLIKILHPKIGPRCLSLKCCSLHGCPFAFHDIPWNIIVVTIRKLVWLMKIWTNISINSGKVLCRGTHCKTWKYKKDGKPFYFSFVVSVTGQHIVGKDRHYQFSLECVKSENETCKKVMLKGINPS